MTSQPLNQPLPDGSRRRRTRPPRGRKWAAGASSATSGPSARRGFSLLEVVVAIGVVFTLAAALFTAMGRTRADTRLAVDHLRALEIAQETIDWVLAARLDARGLQALRGQTGSLLDPATGRGVPLPEAVTGLFGRPPDVPPLCLPAQYDSAFFHRTLDLTPLPGDDGRTFLYRVTVTVAWNEGKAPRQIESVSGPPDRMKSISLSTLVADDGECY
ncbi:MAG: type II secretion system protein [Candidatus Riflebacteria bacterium]|nr:type II secretion system protein [Candidatus Riflebacteria bacterium]